MSDKPELVSSKEEVWQLVESLLSHVEDCPFGWLDGRMTAAKGEAENIAWLERLHSLKKRISNTEDGR